VSSRNGCPDHFRLLVQRYQRPLFAYLSSRLGNHLEAEEAAQESFVRAFLSLKKLRKPESFYAWLLGIAGRVLKEQFRAVERRQKDRAVAETCWRRIPAARRSIRWRKSSPSCLNPIVR
jgi:RNA polymerase sigma-70 factor (ECF subfamily)